MRSKLRRAHDRAWRPAGLSGATGHEIIPRSSYGHHNAYSSSILGILLPDAQVLCFRPTWFSGGSRFLLTDANGARMLTTPAATIAIPERSLPLQLWPQWTVSRGDALK
jgi:hypothetical protein